jgi:thioredoxin-like negative regulator of GroEL
VESGRYQEVLSLLKTLAPEVRSQGRLALLEARACLELGDFNAVEAILQSRPVVPDIREGEVSLTDLWFQLHERRVAQEENVASDDALRERIQKEYPAPPWLDFRQN